MAGGRSCWGVSSARATRGRDRAAREAAEALRKERREGMAGRGGVGLRELGGASDGARATGRELGGASDGAGAMVRDRLLAPGRMRLLAGSCCSVAGSDTPRQRADAGRSCRLQFAGRCCAHGGASGVHGRSFHDIAQTHECWPRVDTHRSARSRERERRVRRWWRPSRPGTTTALQGATANPPPPATAQANRREIMAREYALAPRLGTVPRSRVQSR